MVEYIQVYRNITEEERAYIYANPQKIILIPKDSQYIRESQFENKIVFIETADIYAENERSTKKNVLNFAHQKINDKTPAELLQFKKHSLWYYFRFRLYSQLTTSFFEFRLFSHCLATYNGSHIVLSSNNIVREYIQKNNLENIELKELPVAKKSVNKLNLLKFLVVFLWRSIVGFFYLKKIKKAKFAVISNAIDTQPVMNIDTFKIQKGSHLSQYYQQHLANKNDFINMSELYPLNIFSDRGLTMGEHLFFRKYSNQIYLETIFFKALFSPTLWGKVKKEINKLKNSLHRLKDADLDFEDGFIRDKVFSFRRLMFFTIFRKVVLESFFEKNNFQAVGGTNEQDPKVRSVLESASNVGVKTYGIQHGIIHPFHMAYMFSKEDAKYEVYPSKTYVWGDFWKDTLESNSIYHNKDLEVVGQIRTDIIPKLTSLNHTKYIQEEDKNKTIIFYPSQPLHSREKLALDLFKYIKERSDVVLYIKPHPMEFDCNQFYSSLAKKLRVNNIKVINDDLFLMLSYSDIVVIYNSTVGAEAAYFHKPVIVLNYDNNDYNGFIEEGFAYGVANGQELNNTLNNIIDFKDRLSKEKYDKFINKMSYKIDGKVAKRIEESVRNLPTL